MYVHVPVHVSIATPRGTEEGMRSPKVVIRGNCEPSDVGTGNKLRSSLRTVSTLSRL